MPDPAACNHLLQFYLPMYFYGITLCPTAPLCPHPSWPAALEHTAASSLPLLVMKKVYSLKKAQTHMVQHLICFKSHKSQGENPPLHICLGVRVWISPEKSLLSAFEGSSFAFDVAISEELALSHRVFPSQIPWLLGFIYSSYRKLEAESYNTLLYNTLTLLTIHFRCY